MADGPAETGPEGRRPDRDVFEHVRAVADAVLYEGYLLYPYRRSSGKNRVRWQFGVLAPRAWAEANCPDTGGVAGAAESWQQRTECLVRAPRDAVVHARVRYLQFQRKSVERRSAAGHAPVDRLEAAGELHLSFDEAVPREADVLVPLADLLRGGRTAQVGGPAGEESEELPAGAGRIVRRRYAVEATTTLRAERLEPARDLYRLSVHTRNTGHSVTPRAPREEALRHALIATHTVLGGDGLHFVSLIDPPEGAEQHARACRNLHTFPVLAGDEGTDGLVLSAPIILPDHPQIAPESPGDLHDAGEIVEILTLRTMLLSDEEKREARATDRRAAEILDRVDTMPPEILSRLHGAIRSLEPRPPAVPSPADHDPLARATTPWWEEGGDEGLSPSTDTVSVEGTRVGRGSRVRLRPLGRGTDAHDMFLEGRTATVAGVFHDVDGSVQVAVTLDDDPATELHLWYGRYFYFRPEELHPLPADGYSESSSSAGHSGADGPPSDCSVQMTLPPGV
jgi:hypothetical protein